MKRQTQLGEFAEFKEAVDNYERCLEEYHRFLERLK